MGLVNKGISIIHFDQTYFAQRKLQIYSHEDINLQDMRHVNLYCEEESLSALKRNLNTRTKKGITFIGNGNYHYITYLLLKEIKKPFTLVLFDNHPDLGSNQDPDRSLLSCGSWVSFALKRIPILQQVVIIGPTTAHADYSTDPRVAIFPFDDNRHYPLKLILSLIQTQHVYISVDKDVLNTSEVLTNWDQGRMNLETLTYYLKNILNDKQAEGVDICGEIQISPVHSFLPDYQTMIQKNEKANLKILQTCLNTGSLQSKGA